MRMKFFLAGFCCVLLISCSKGVVSVENVKGNEMLVCNISGLNNKVESILLSELVKSVDVVKLETNDSCLVKDIRKIYITDNFIGVLEQHDQCPYKLFDRKGNYITNIGNIGQGPHEYTDLYNSSIDEKNNRIYLMPFYRVDKLLCYDLEGNPYDDIPLYYKNLDKPSFFIDNDVITVFSIPITNKDIFVFQQNMKGELIKSIPATEDLHSNDYGNELFTSYNKGVFSIHYTAKDTLFNYEPESNKLVPKYSTKSDGNSSLIYREWPSHYLTTVMSRPNPSKNIMIDKKTKKANYYKIEDDFLGGLEVKYLVINNDYLVVKYEAFQLLEDLEKAINKPDLREDVRDRISNLVNTVNESDNPILIISKWID